MCGELRFQIATLVLLVQATTVGFCLYGIYLWSSAPEKYSVLFFIGSLGACVAGTCCTVATAVDLREMCLASRRNIRGAEVPLDDSYFRHQNSDDEAGQSSVNTSSAVYCVPVTLR